MASLMIAVVALVVASPAWAQYPPQGTTTTVHVTTTTATTGTQNLGTHVLGETIVGEGCGFASGSAVSVSVNGKVVLTKTADANGCVKVRIKIVSGTLAQVDDPVNAAITCGANNWVATGRNSAGAAVTQTANFTVNCAAATTTATKGTTARTGAEILRWTLVALALVAVGGGLVLADRRRGRRAAK